MKKNQFKAILLSVFALATFLLGTYNTKLGLKKDILSKSQFGVASHLAKSANNCDIERTFIKLK